MNPLNLASMATHLAPLATRTVAGLADALGSGSATFLETLTNRDATVDETSEATESYPSTTPDGAFAQRYAQLQRKLQELLDSVAGVSGDAIPWQIGVDSQGRLELSAPEGDVDPARLSTLEQWLNANHELTRLGAAAYAAKQQQDWSSGLPNASPAQDALYLRIETGGH